jgi:hypothetical protein
MSGVLKRRWRAAVFLLSHYLPRYLRDTSIDQVLKMILLEEVNDVLAVADKRCAREVKGPSASCLNIDKYDECLDHDAGKDFFSSSRDRIVWPPVSSSNEEPEGMLGTVEYWGSKKARCERCVENASAMRSSDMCVLSRTDLDSYCPL